jgi:hypothetical protein
MGKATFSEGTYDYQPEDWERATQEVHQHPIFAVLDAMQLDLWERLKW